MTNLTVIITNICNFLCDHCINHSSPKGDIEISSLEIKRIISDISKIDHLERINITGGEPTLYLEKVYELVSGLSDKKIDFTITTNGSLDLTCDKSIKLFKKIGFKEAIISYDRYHQNFISEDQLIQFCKFCKSNNITTTLNFTPNEIHDFAITTNLAKYVDRKKINNLISGGRSKNIPSLKESKCSRIKCDAFSINGEIKELLFVPRQGYTICCGPVNFDNVIDKKLIFKDHPDENTFLEEFFLKLQTDTSNLKYIQDCDSCTDYFKNSDLSLINNLNDDFFPIILDNSPRIQNLASKNTRLNPIFLLAKKSNLYDDKSTVLPTPIPSHVSSQDILGFLDKNFYDPFKQFFSKDEINSSREQFETFINNKNLPSYFLITTKENKISSLLYCIKLNHPVYKTDALHIGYWGYDKDLLSQNEARNLKRDWIRHIENWSRNVPLLTVSIDSFNQASLRFAEKNGFVINKVKFDLKKHD